VPAARFVSGFVEALQRIRRTTRLRRDDCRDDPQDALDTTEAAGDLVVLDATGPDVSWQQFCRRSADSLVIIADPGAVPRAVPESGVAPDLVLWGHGPRLGAWLLNTQPRAHHHVRPGTNEAADVARIARRLTGTSLGVVLSGGGARGLAHIGVLTCLREHDITVDRFGGTSMGALVGALAATGIPEGTIAEVCRRELVQRRPFADYGIPHVSLIKGRRAMKLFRDLFGSTPIETLPHDFFCTSTDLISSDLVVHRRGPPPRPSRRAWHCRALHRPCEATVGSSSTAVCSPTCQSV
jgi:NTE family protein